ncbi:hypothetical protein NDU88_004808, partial [Pleurodeles waltl]
VAVTAKSTNRVGPLKEYPRSTLNNNIRFIGGANPEEEGCNAAQMEERKKTPGTEEDGRKDTWKEARSPNNIRREDSEAELEDSNEE